MCLPVILLMIGCEDIPSFVKETDPPTIKGFSPQTAPIGTDITIEGENLQWIDSVYIGGQKVNIKYKLSATKLVATITNNARSGSVKLFAKGGTSESSQDFIVDFVVPAVYSVPELAKVNEEIEITGENMLAVTQVKIGGVIAKVIIQNNSDMIVKVPFTEADPGKIEFDYFDGNIMTFVESPDEMEVVTEVPRIDNFPSTIMAAKTYQLEGRNLMNVEEVLVNGYAARIIPWINQSDSADIVDGKLLKFNVPTTYFTSTTTGVELIVTYYGGQIKDVTNNLTINPVVHPATYLQWDDIVLYAQDPSTTQNFFSPADGTIYSPCMVLNKKEDIYFYLRAGGKPTDMTSSLQLVNPNNSDTDINLYTCDGTKIPNQKLPNFVQYRPFTSGETSTNYIKMRDYVMNGQIADAFILQKTPPEYAIRSGSNTPRTYIPGSSSANNFFKGYPILFQKMDISNGTDSRVPIDNGFIMVKQVSFHPSNNNRSYIVMDVYFKQYN